MLNSISQKVLLLATLMCCGGMSAPAQAACESIAIRGDNNNVICQTIVVNRPSLEPAQRGEAISCREENQLRSLPTTRPTSIAFSNAGAETKRVYWLDHQGRRKLYAVLDPDQRINLTTYITHPWVITDSLENCEAVYMPGPLPQNIVLR